MKCPVCNHLESKVVDSRYIENGTVIRRRRECVECGNRFTTYERIDSTHILVIKKDGTREAYNSEKIKSGILKACEKRPISLKQIEELVSSIENEIRSTIGSGEIESNYIGGIVMNKLKELDKVAYVRFASVYRQFEDIGSFMDELNSLVNEPSEKNQ
ncbi:MAG: transcriptional regulator NrdR [Eubacteriales bacterium]|nr:transcriptional regulator NrdR [Eubacteriales bacterium]